jgi:hypothetical protein
MEYACSWMRFVPGLTTLEAIVEIQ